MSDYPESKNIAVDCVPGACESLPAGLSATETRRIDKALARLEPVAQLLRESAVGASQDAEAAFQRALRELSLD